MSKRQHWLAIHDPSSRWAIIAIASAVFVCGVFWRHAGLLGGGAVALCLVLRRVGDDVEERHATESRRKRRSAQARPQIDGANPIDEPHSSQATPQSGRP